MEGGRCGTRPPWFKAVRKLERGRRSFAGRAGWWVCGAGQVIRLRRGPGWKQGFWAESEARSGVGLRGGLRVVGGALEGFETAAGFKAAAGTGEVSPWQIDPRPFLPQTSSPSVLLKDHDASVSVSGQQQAGLRLCWRVVPRPGSQLHSLRLGE